MVAGRFCTVIGTVQMRQFVIKQLDSIYSEGKKKLVHSQGEVVALIAVKILQKRAWLLL